VPRDRLLGLARDVVNEGRRGSGLDELLVHVALHRFEDLARGLLGDVSSARELRKLRRAKRLASALDDRLLASLRELDGGERLAFVQLLQLADGAEVGDDDLCTGSRRL